MNKNINLLEGNIKSTLLRLSIPLALTAFIQIAYGFVDMLWIAKLGTNAVAGVGIAGFVFWIANSLALIPKIGMGVYASQAYGSNHKDETIRVINNGLLQALILGLLFTLFSLAVRNLFIEFYQLGMEAEQSAKEYMTIVASGMLLFFVNPILTQSFTSLGNSFTPFVINTIGLVANMILDPVLIFGFGTIEPQGVEGAAWATVLSQLFVFFAFIMTILIENGLLRRAITRITLRWDWQVAIFKLGIPAALLSGFHASISMVLNRFMSGFGPTPVAVTSIGSQIESISWNTSEGLQVGIQALVAQNFGAGNAKRVIESIRESFKLISMIGVIATIVLVVFSEGLFTMFMPHDPEAIRLGSIYLIILGLSQAFMSIEIGLAGAFNGLSDTRTPALIGVILNLFRIPISLVLMPILGVIGVWIAMSSTSIAKGVVSMYLLRRKVNRMEWLIENR